MKKIVFLLLFSFASGYAMAQSVKMVYKGDTLRNGDTLRLVQMQSNTLVEITFGMINTTSDSVLVKASKTTVSEQGVDVSLCFGESCYDSSINETPDSYAVAPGVIDTNFFLGINLNRKSGVYLIRLKLFNESNPADGTEIYVLFSSTTSIADNKEKNSLKTLAASPNPATDKVAIQYALDSSMPMQDAKLVIRNLIGNTVAIIPLTANNDKINLDISTYTSGIYFYSIVANDKILSTKKLVVR